MSNPGEFQIGKDRSGNTFENTANKRYLADSTYFKSSLGSAAAALATVAAETGYHMVVDFAQVVIASIAANTTVLATLTDGTTSWPVGAFSGNGVYTLVDERLKSFGIKGASGGAMVLKTDTPGTGGSSVVSLACHKVKAADV